MSRSRSLSLLAVVCALAAAGAGAAIAADGDDARKAEQAVIDDAAERLGTTPQELRSALGAALDAQLDEAVEAGRLTPEQADEIKRRRRESGRVLGLPGGRGHLHHRLRGPGGPRGAGFLSDVAGALGITPARLMARLHDGDTLAEIARDRGKTVAQVKRSAKAAGGKRLDEAVDEGDLTRAQADAMLEHLEEHIDALARGERPRLGRRGPGHGPPPFGR